MKELYIVMYLDPYGDKDIYAIHESYDGAVRAILTFAKENDEELNLQETINDLKEYGTIGIGRGNEVWIETKTLYQ